MFGMQTNVNKIIYLTIIAKKSLLITGGFCFMDFCRYFLRTRTGVVTLTDWVPVGTMDNL